MKCLSHTNVCRVRLKFITHKKNTYQQQEQQELLTKNGTNDSKNDLFAESSV